MKRTMIRFSPRRCERRTGVGAARRTAAAGRAAARSSGPPEHAKVTPINNLPNPYETIRNWARCPTTATGDR